LTLFIYLFIKLSFNDIFMQLTKIISQLSLFTLLGVMVISSPTPSASAVTRTVGSLSDSQIQTWAGCPSNTNPYRSQYSSYGNCYNAISRQWFKLDLDAACRYYYGGHSVPYLAGWGYNYGTLCRIF
jgi:hypothetical protein